jgi:hypothetical protein
MPLMSNYKGFPLCQANEVHEPRERLDSYLDFVFGLRLHRAAALFVNGSSKGADGQTTTGHSCSFNSAADPDERRARGPQFFVLKRYRRAGVGLALAQHVFRSHPGPWEVGQMPGNVARGRSGDASSPS